MGNKITEIIARSIQLRVRHPVRPGDLLPGVRVFIERMDMMQRVAVPPAAHATMTGWIASR